MNRRLFTIYKGTNHIELHLSLITLVLYTNMFWIRWLYWIGYVNYNTWVIRVGPFQLSYWRSY